MSKKFQFHQRDKSSGAVQEDCGIGQGVQAFTEKSIVSMALGMRNATFFTG